MLDRERNMKFVDHARQEEDRVSALPIALIDSRKRCRRVKLIWLGTLLVNIYDAIMLLDNIHVIILKIIIIYAYFFFLTSVIKVDGRLY